MDFTKLAELLANETYPHKYIHKFIGNKTPAFLKAVSELEGKFPAARRSGEREANDSRGGQYLALTYEFTATCPDEIIELFKATLTLPDLKIIL